ncbi:MAG: hypothetical protein ACRCYU_12055 [Nocardioides sp.]
MGLFSNAPTRVYLIEDHSDGDNPPYTRYWKHVYLSLDKAKAGIETYAKHGSRGPLRWVDRGGVQYAYPAASDDAVQELYRVITLDVRTDDQPEP